MWPRHVNLSKTASRTCFRETFHPDSEMASQNYPNGMFAKNDPNFGCECAWLVVVVVVVVVSHNKNPPAPRKPKGRPGRPFAGAHGGGSCECAWLWVYDKPLFIIVCAISSTRLKNAARLKLVRARSMHTQARQLVAARQ